MKGSLPLSSYPTKGDSEVIPKGLPSSQAYSGSAIGSDPGAHSSTTPSVDASQNVQWNDDELGNPAAGILDQGGYDPNMSGPHPSEPIEERYASVASPWRENNDYLEYMFNTEDVPLSRLLCMAPSGFTANGGIPALPNRDVGSNDSVMEFGSDSVSPEGEFGSSPSYIAGIMVSAVVRRS